MAKMIVAKSGCDVETKMCRWEIQNYHELLFNDDLINQQFEFQFTDSKGTKSSWRFWISIAEIQGMLFAEGYVTRTVTLQYMLMREDGCCGEIDARVSIQMEIGGVTIAEGRSENSRHQAGDEQDCHLEQLGMELPNDFILVIKIKFEILTKAETKVTEKEIVEIEENETQEERMQLLDQWIAKLENDKEFSDMRIVSSDGMYFYAHRCILSGISKALKNDVAKDKTIMKLEMLSGSTLKVLLHFIYTGKVANEWSNPGILEELIPAADKYEIKGLKKFLETNLGKICTLENAGSLLTLALETNLKKAAANIGKFVAENAEHSPAKKAKTA